MAPIDSLRPAVARSAPLLTLTRVNFQFPAANGGWIRVLNNVSLEVRPAETIAVLGPSGCGKSTLLRVIAGLLNPIEGHRLLDEALASSPLSISMNFQKPVLLPWLTVSQNALLPFELSRRPVTSAITERLNRLLQLVGLYGFRDALPSELSGGMMMRASLVRSFVTGPRLLLMDEPFASLDEVTRNRLCVELRDLAQTESTAIVFVTHNIQEAVFVSNRVALFSARPAHIVASLDIDLPDRRSDDLRRSPRYLDLCDRLYAEIAHG
jgi:NitT/TauT family transport system ATP-binding protein